ncbi:AMP-binding protein [Flagellimonas sp. 2504JD4-2]
MMQNQTWRKVHPDFKLNGVHYKFDELQEVGCSLVKEGSDYEIPMGEFLLDWSTDKSAAEVYTSGSTGKPKKIELKKLHMVNSAIATGKHFGLSPKNTALLCLPTYGIAGKMMLVRAMVLGLNLRSLAPSSTPLLGIENNFDFAAMVPMQVENSIAQLSQISTLLIGGAPVSTSLGEALKDTPTDVYETYGMTETITHIAVKKLNNVSSSVVENSFKTLPDISISTDDRDCLVITAPNISDQEVITNDVVQITGETTFEWLGRYDSIINSGGIKLIPEQIEKKLSPIIDGRFFVAGIPDKSLGQKLILVVESSNISREELLKQVGTIKDFGKYEIPKEIFQIDAFVETESGKIHRSQTIKLL